ncbi:hypothetical protein [Geoalkalibacter sp.]|uniref:hypothetical protein n=1 Tax=Geoalkalibacter sp. TaxID=3041440 RepID=UPI00272ED2A1|nr:hypothetical protein [Geoalkalibacter sp.]
MAEPGLTLNQLLGQDRPEWHGVKLGQPDRGDDSHSLALTAWSLRRRLALHILVNAWRKPLLLELPPAWDLPNGGWRRRLDTSLPSPADIVPPDEAPDVGDGLYTLPAHSVAVLSARADSRHSQEVS